MKITEIEVHEISVPYVDWLAHPLNHYYGLSKRYVYIAHTDTGLEGLGEGHALYDREFLDQYIGTNPFDWIADQTSLCVGTAMYDLMGKAAGVPCYKLFGQKARSWVPRGSWTVSTHPKKMAEAVERYAHDGYTWMKFHLSPFENIFDQVEAMQAVAPVGFKIHYDFTMHGTADHMPELLHALEQYPISGCFEDAVDAQDIPAQIELRQNCTLPIVLHHAPLGFTHDVMMRAADACMLGHAPIGNAMRAAGFFASINMPFMLQNTGGHITTTMVAHLMAAAPTGKFHFITTAETLADDVVNERPEIVNGFVRVPDSPGLGLTLDRDALERLKNLTLPETAPWIIKSRFANGTMMYDIHDTAQPIHMVRPDRRKQINLSFQDPISTEYWDDDGSTEFKQIFDRVRREGVYLEKP